MSSVTGQEKNASPALTDVLAYIRAEIADGTDVALKNSEAKLLIDEFDRRLEHVDTCTCTDCCETAVREAEEREFA